MQNKSQNKLKKYILILTTDLGLTDSNSLFYLVFFL